MRLISSMSHKALVVLVTIATLFLAGGSAFAQTTKGKVTDVNGLPVIGASVIEVGNTSNGVITDIDGNFELKVAAGKQLEVSCIGYVGCRNEPLSVRIPQRSQEELYLLVKCNHEICRKIVGTIDGQD